MKTKKIKLEVLRLDGDTQPRVAIDQSVVSEYAEAMEAGKVFPPVAVYHDGAAYWLVDGFHRYHAARKLDLTEIEAVVKTGVKQEAQWASLSMNQGHGLRRTNADKQKAVFKALILRPEMTDRAIADHIGVSHQTIANYRNSNKVDSEKTATVKVLQSTLCKGRDGRTYKVGNMRRQAKRRRENKISPKALPPVRDAIPMPPMKAMSMPYNPIAGANALLAIFDREYIQALIAELQARLNASSTN